jgi:hypothetical protein
MSQTADAGSIKSDERGDGHSSRVGKQDEASPQLAPRAEIANCVRDQHIVLVQFPFSYRMTRLGASSLCVNHLEPFANNWHRLVKGSILEVITAKVEPISAEHVAVLMPCLTSAANSSPDFFESPKLKIPAGFG